jgi:hypothetical protein
MRQGISGASVRWGRMSRWPIFLLVLCACALGLVACGGDDSGGSGDDDVATILAETFGEGKEVKSGRLDLNLRLNTEGLANVSGPLGVRLSGPFQSSGSKELPRFDFDAALDLSGQQIKAGAVSTGDKGFLKFQDQAYAVSEQLFEQFRKGYAEQAACNSGKDAKDGVSFSSLGVRPARWLKDAKKGGEEKVGGAPTTRISGTIDVPVFLEDVNRILGRTNPQQADPCADQPEAAQPEQGSNRPRQLSAAERKQIAAAVKNAKVEIWTGAEDRTMRRINVTLGFDVPEGQRAAANGLQRGDIRFDMTIGALNEKQTIKAPSGAKPLEELTAQLGGAVPGVSGATQGQSGSGTSGSGTPGAAGGANGATGGSAYDQCLSSAGQDVKKLQECADLIGQ